MSLSNLPRWFPLCRGCCETATYLWRENHRSRLSSGRRRAHCRRWEGLWPAPGGPLHANTPNVKSFFIHHYVKLLVRALSADDELWCYKPNTALQSIQSIQLQQQSLQFVLRSVTTMNSPVPRGSFSWDREIRIPSWGEKKKRETFRMLQHHKLHHSTVPCCTEEYLTLATETIKIFENCFLRWKYREEFGDFWQSDFIWTQRSRPLLPIRKNSGLRCVLTGFIYQTLILIHIYSDTLRGCDDMLHSSDGVYVG